MNDVTVYTEKWDFRFMDLAHLVASWSKDPSTKVGAVIARPDHTIVSTGYNGFPRGCLDTEEFYENRELKYARVVHAETNAILHARERLNGYTIYVTHPTCDRCATNVIQSGIDRVVFDLAGMAVAERWGKAIQIAFDMYAEAGVRVFGVERPVY